MHTFIKNGVFRTIAFSVSIGLLLVNQSTFAQTPSSTVSSTTSMASNQPKLAVTLNAGEASVSKDAKSYCLHSR
ncbi:MAG TPA: hypothetical protein DCW35_04030 [Polynucleobacter sp.]|nr:hypothetical protein [Polynucleobacter sp.]